MEINKWYNIFKWHKCDWCGVLDDSSNFIKIDGKEYCTGMCAEHKRVFTIQ